MIERGVCENRNLMSGSSGCSIYSERILSRRSFGSAYTVSFSSPVVLFLSSAISYMSPPIIPSNIPFPIYTLPVALLPIKKPAHMPPNTNHPLTTSQTANPLPSFLSLSLQTCAPLHSIPNLYSPNAATTLSPMGSGFIVFSALGNDDPARSSEAASASSRP